VIQQARKLAILAFTGMLILVLLSACAAAPASALVVNTPVVETAAGPPSGVILYASDLPSEALTDKE